MSKNSIKSYRSGDGYISHFRLPKSRSTVIRNQSSVDELKEEGFNVPNRLESRSKYNFDRLPSAWDDLDISQRPWIQSKCWDEEKFENTGLPKSLKKLWNHYKANETKEFAYGFWIYGEKTLRNHENKKFKRLNERRKLRKEKMLQKQI